MSRRWVAAPAPAADDPGTADSGPWPEPIYTESIRRDIQGNIVPGFNKDHQHFLFLSVSDPDRARQWVAGIAPSITSMDEALAFVQQFRAQRLAQGVRAPEGL